MSTITETPYSMEKFNSALSQFKDELFQSFIETAELAAAAQTLPQVESKTTLIRINNDDDGPNPGDTHIPAREPVATDESRCDGEGTPSQPVRKPLKHVAKPLISSVDIEGAARTAEVATDLIANTIGSEYENLLRQLADLQNDFYSCLQEISQAAANDVEKAQGRSVTLPLSRNQKNKEGRGEEIADAEMKVEIEAEAQVEVEAGLAGAKATLMALVDLENSCKKSQLQNSITKVKERNTNKGASGFTLFMKSFYADQIKNGESNVKPDVKPGACGRAWQLLPDDEKRKWTAKSKTR